MPEIVEEILAANKAMVDKHNRGEDLTAEDYQQWLNTIMAGVMSDEVSPFGMLVLMELIDTLLSLVELDGFTADLDEATGTFTVTSKPTEVTSEQ